ncbi:hypothetical protein BKA65DRAFT_548127 [Rhexocercosporidium sp. MPI-PUGE-AT-0058]|nr:hypothetical protein BKA65DRAFT_548127 [Rhexocercosporidium sp. MPI-PUGE-AT-0058]
MPLLKKSPGLTIKERSINIITPGTNIAEIPAEDERADEDTDSEASNSKGFEYEPWAGLWEGSSDNICAILGFEAYNNKVHTLKDLADPSSKVLTEASMKRAKRDSKVNSSRAQKQLPRIPVAPAPIPNQVIPVTVKRNDYNTDPDLPALKEFYFFPYLPTRIRYQLFQYAKDFWQEPPNFRMQYTIPTYINDSPIAGWKFRPGPKEECISAIAPLLHVCQEFRIWTMASGWEMVPIDRRDSEQAVGKRMFNFETGMMVWDSNANAVARSMALYEPMPPRELPLQWEALHKIRRLGVTETLWFDWPFAIDRVTDLHALWKRKVLGIPRLEKLRLVIECTEDSELASKKSSMRLQKFLTSTGIETIPPYLEVDVVTMEDLNFK